MLAISFAALAAAFLLVFLAEMGDKTQFIAMTYAAKHSPYKVLLAVFLATLANFAIVIAIGELLAGIVPLDVISLAASISFIGFGLWALRGEKGGNENLRSSRFGVVATVGIAFFLAEFGDKTQLTTLSLAARYQSPIGVLIGAILGMLVADGIGIVIGVVFCRRIPQRLLKWLSAVVFVAFGLAGVYDVLIGKIGIGYTAVALLAVTVVLAVVMLGVARKQMLSKRKKKLVKLKLS